MKNIFGVNNEKYNGQIFVDRSIDQEMQKELDEGLEEVNEYVKKTSISPVLSFIRYIGYIYPIFIFGVLFEASSDETPIDQVIEKNPWVIISSIVSLLVAIIITIYSIIKRKTQSSKEKENTMEEKANDIEKRFKEFLNIPDEAPVIDVLVGIEEVDKKGLVKAKYMPLATSVFKENEAICFAALDMVFKINLSEIKGVYQKGKMNFLSWNKDETPKGNKYNGHKVVVQNGLSYTTECYSITIENDFDEYEIIIPCYDIQVVKDLLEIEITEMER